ncbi:MAG: 4-phosphopantoate--beta-alanine ligase, partial [Bacteroidales bacterium]
MKVIHTNAALHECLQQQSSIGFVPTMGALHKGHLSLVERSKKENQTTVVSIFVNPTQFNDKGDLARYPRNLNQDIALLEQVGCDLIYAPNEAEVYPQKDTRQFDFGLLEQVMEGKHRPGHFNGVAQVVSRLFDLVKPQRAYFGEKDFQQLAIIR